MAVQSKQFFDLPASKDNIEKIESESVSLIVKVFQIAHSKEEDLNSLKQKCFTAVLMTIENKNWENVEKIQKALMSIRYKRRNFLCHAVSLNKKASVQYVVEKNMHKFLPKEEWQQSVHQAAKTGDKEIFQLLIENGIGTIHGKDPKGRVPFHLVVKKGHVHLIDPLLNLGAFPGLRYVHETKKRKLELCPVSIAVYYGQTSTLDKLLENPHVSIPTKIDTIGNLLHFAIFFGKKEMLRHLLSKHFEKIKDLMEDQDFQGKTSLALASSLNDCVSIYLLLKKNAKIESVDYNKRTSMHHAALNKCKEALILLFKNEAMIDSLDACVKRPVDLVTGKDPESQEIINLFETFTGLKERQKFQWPDFTIQNPENLVFKGGALKAFAYLEAMKVLEEKNLLSRSKRALGTSSGAITAALFCFGMDAENARKVMNGINFFSFLELNAETLREKITDNLSLSGIAEFIKTVSSLNPAEIGKKVLQQTLLSLWQFKGISSGKTLRRWIDEELKSKTKNKDHPNGIENCTFGELAQLIEQGQVNDCGKSFLHLHVAITLMGKTPEPIKVSSEDPEWRNLVISSAVTASAAFPGAFQPQYLIFKEKEVLREDTSRPCLDGGMLRNFDIGAFDYRGYLFNGLSEEEKKYPIFNTKTLGLCLQAPKEKEQWTKDEPIENVGQLLARFINLYFHAETLLQQNAANEHRVIQIETGGVEVYHTNLSKEQKNQLDKSGREAVLQFLKKNTLDTFNLWSVDPFKVEETKAIVVNDSSKELNLSPDPDLDPLEKVRKVINYFFESGAVVVGGLVLLNPLSIVASPIYAILFQYGFHELAKRDQRFQLFVDLYNGNTALAELAFAENPKFYATLLHLEGFIEFLTLYNRKSYITFFASKKLMPIQEKSKVFQYALCFFRYDAFDALIEFTHAEEWKDENGNTILHYMVKMDRQTYLPRVKDDKLKVMLNKKNKEQQTPLCMAIEMKKEFFIKEFLNHPDIDLTTVQEGQKTLLYLLYQYSLNETWALLLIQKWKQKEILEKMIQEENKENLEKEELLLKIKNKEIIRELIKAGIDLTKREKASHKTLLYELSKMGEFELVQQFCNKFKESNPNEFIPFLNLPVNSSNQKVGKKSAVMIAAEKNQHQIVEYLVEQGAEFMFPPDVEKNYRAIDLTHRTWLRDQSYKVLYRASVGIIGRDLSVQETTQAFINGCEWGEFDLTKKLIMEKIKIPLNMIRTKKQSSPSLLILKSNKFTDVQKIELLEILLEKDHQDDLNHADLTGITPLIWAAQNSGEILIALVKKFPIEINKPDKNKYTALHHVVKNGDLEAVECLLKTANILVNALTNHDETPLHFADNEKIALCLLKRNANPNLKDSGGRTAYQHAALTGNKALTQVIKNYETNGDSNNLLVEML